MSLADVIPIKPPFSVLQFPEHHYLDAQRIHVHLSHPCHAEVNLAARHDSAIAFPPPLYVSRHEIDDHPDAIPRHVGTRSPNIQQHAHPGPEL